MLIWILFFVVIIIFLAIDLGVFNKESHIVSAKEAGVFTTVWVSIAFLFSIAVYYIFSNELVDNHQGYSPLDATIMYITGYLVEISLSMDNIFVISMIFSYFSIPKKYQHRVLFWGILGAVIFRGIMIVIGVVLIEKFSWMIYVFGGILLYSAYKMLHSGEEVEDFSKNPIIKWVKKVFPVTRKLEGQKFFVKKRHILAATPLFIVLLIIELTDVVFAVDSIPAILGITTNTFLVFTSNIFAILGLRSMYFLLDSLISKFHYLKYSLVFILAFVGVKMILSHVIHLPVWVSLGVIVLSLAMGLLFSIYKSKDDTATSG